MPVEVQNIISGVLAWVGALFITGGSLVTAAFWTFKLLSEKWLNAKFEERLSLQACSATGTRTT